jgi:hypothetical protein
MRCIHFILSNMTDKGQASIVWTARIPHYQTPLSEMQHKIASFRGLGGNIEFKIYCPDQNYSNEFLHFLVNLGLQDMTAIGWDALARLASKQAKGDKKRQRKFKDFGTSAGQCTTCVESSVGVAKPSFKPGTKDAFIVNAMLALCRYTKKAKLRWIPKGLHPFNCNDPEDSPKKFAQQFHTDCFIPVA